MFKLFIIILLSIINLLCYAQKLEQPQPLVIVDKNKLYHIDKSNHFYDVKVLFNEFTTGKKYCKRDTKDWDDQCQDAVMYHIYGKNWRKFKNIVLEFIKAAKRGDSKAIENLYTPPPMNFLLLIVHEDGSLEHKFDIAVDEVQFLYILEHKYLPIIQNKMRHVFMQYKNFMIFQYLNKTEDSLISYKIYLGGGISIYFEPPHLKFADYNDDSYTPKILSIHLIVKHKELNK